MSPRRYVNRFIVLAILCGTLVLGSSLSKPFADALFEPAHAAQSKLGDLTRFRAIAADGRAFVQRGDWAGAKARFKDLETSWDEAEAGLKPRAVLDWHSLDKAIDRALGAVRADPPDRATAEAAIDQVLSTIDRYAGR